MVEPRRHTRELLLKLFFAHAAAEKTLNVDGIMATLCEDPVYEIFPAGLRLQGKPAVREFYEKILPAFTVEVPPASGFFGKLSDSPVEILWIGEESIVSRDDFMLVGKDGTARDFRHLTVVSLSGDLLLGEMMFSTAACAEVMLEALGEEFLTRPGVSRII